jgi:Fe-S-cluster containining protein
VRRVLRVRALSIHADYRCRHSGACCSSGWAIPVEPETEERLRTALLKGPLRLPVRRDLVPPGSVPAEPESCLQCVASLPHGARVVLRTDDTGRCVFFDPSFAPSGRCSVHRVLGEDALPSACRQFPRVVTLTPLGVSVTLSHYCPTAAGSLFRAVAPNADRPLDGRAGLVPGSTALHIVEGPGAFPAEWPYEGLDARDALPPLLRPGVLMDWPGLEAWERFVVSVLTEEGLGPEAALDVLATAAEEARRWTPERGAFGGYFEEVLGTLAGGRSTGEELAFHRSLRGEGPAPSGAVRSGSRSPRDPASRGSRGVQAWQLVADTVPQGAASHLAHGVRLGDLPRLSPAGLGEADERWVVPAWPSLSLPIRRWLAARAFASWIALQGEGLRTTVAYLATALGVLRTEAARGSAATGRVLDAGQLLAAVRRADLLLLHLADPEDLAGRLSRCESRAP